MLTRFYPILGFLHLGIVCHLGLDNSLLWRPGLCIVGRLAASLASAHWMTHSFPSSCDDQEYLQTLPTGPLGQNHFQVRAAAPAPATPSFTRVITVALQLASLLSLLVSYILPSSQSDFFFLLIQNVFIGMASRSS